MEQMQVNGPVMQKDSEDREGKEEMSTVCSSPLVNVLACHIVSKIGERERERERV